MIKFENTEVFGWGAAIRGMRNPMNSWNRSDSGYCNILSKLNKTGCEICPIKDSDPSTCYDKNPYIIGPNDLDLMKRLRNAGTDHRKYLRMIHVQADVTAPLYWYKEYDTYKIGTVANSCSTMHKIADKEFVLDDFSYEHLMSTEENGVSGEAIALSTLQGVIMALNFYRNLYIKTKNKKYWYQMIQLLPTSYNQKRTIDLNYENLINMYHARKNHKLDEWREFCTWIESLPYSELIIGEKKDGD